MKSNPFLLTCLLFFLFLPFHAFGGYPESLNTWETYTPPDLTPAYEDRDTGTKQTRPVLPPKTGADSPQPELTLWNTRLTEVLRKSAFLSSSVPEDSVPGTRPGKGINLDGAVSALGSRFLPQDIEILILGRNPSVGSAWSAFQAELDGFGQVDGLMAVLQRYAAFLPAARPGLGPMIQAPAGTGAVFPFPGLFSLQIGAVYQDAAIKAVELNKTIRDRITEGRKIYWHLVFLDRKKEILEETLELFHQLDEVANTLYRAGKTGFQDVIRITIRVQLLEKELRTLDEQKTSVQTDLLALADLPAGTMVGLPAAAPETKPAPAPEALTRKALEHRQEIRRLEHALQKMEIMIEMGETMILPSQARTFSYASPAVAATGTWSKNPAFQTGTSPFAGAGMPLNPWFGSRASWLEQTRQKKEALFLALSDARSHTPAMVRASWFRLDDALRTLRLYEDEILDLTASALEVATREYEAGTITFSEVTGAYNDWLDARLSLAAAVRDAGQAKAVLEQTIGISF